MGSPEPHAQARFDAMGTRCHVVVHGDPALVAVARRRIEGLERRWSRFDPHSEVRALWRHAGRPVMVSTDTLVLVERAVLAWAVTGGRFDPTVGAALEALGYDRSFERMEQVVPSAGTGPGSGAAPGCAGIEVDAAVGVVKIPRGVRFDSGGIGKGLAADLAAAELAAAGAAGALVNVGGDLRVVGSPATGAGWVVGIDHPSRAGAELARLALREGAVATSSRLLRRWRVGAADVHHLLDPRTGMPPGHDVDAVTVVAGEAWWAEAASKALFVDPADPPPGVSALVVRAGGTVAHVGLVDDFLVGVAS